MCGWFQTRGWDSRGSVEVDPDIFGDQINVGAGIDAGVPWSIGMGEQISLILAVPREVRSGK